MPTPTPDVQSALIARAVQAETSVRSGQLEAVTDYGNGTRASARITFDLGSASEPPRLHMLTSYAGPAATQVVELIMVGDQAWQRTGSGPWIVPGNLESPWGTVRSFLPAVDDAPEPEIRETGQLAVLAWHDAGRNADITLEIDAITGIPARLTRVVRSNGVTLSVTYQSWNMPVEITPPSGG